MFRSALIKLTGVYVLLAMVLSLGFTVVYYRLATRELSKGLTHQYERILENDHDFDNTSAYDRISRSVLEDRKENIRSELLAVNFVVLASSIVVGYILARRTLQPIEEAHRSQMRFTAEASHELKTPLTAMKADTESMLMSKGARASELRATLQSNLEDIERLERLTRHLLDMGRYRSGAKLQMEAIDLERLMHGVARQLRIQYKSKQVDVVCSTSVSVVYAERLSLEQLLVILADNAVKYSPRGATVRITAVQERHDVVITVQDSGRGIDPEDQPHVFEHFYRSKHGSSSKRASGYGLGLPLAKDIVAIHRGSITVVSEPDKGTTVTVKLPLKTG